MPTYEFRCPMGHEFEQFYRSISGAPSEVACPTCGKKAERQISAGGGLVFKGSGFYITDYGKDGKKSQTARRASGETSTTGAGESGAKGDSQSAGESRPAAESKSSGETKSSGESKSSSESKSSGESKPRDPKPAAASKSAAKGSSGRAKRSE
jgi:putative FmdB family regulatory protein